MVCGTDDGENALEAKFVGVAGFDVEAGSEVELIVAARTKTTSLMTTTVPVAPAPKPDAKPG